MCNGVLYRSAVVVLKDLIRRCVGGCRKEFGTAPQTKEERRRIRKRKKKSPLYFWKLDNGCDGPSSRQRSFAAESTSAEIPSRPKLLGRCVETLRMFVSSYRCVEVTPEEKQCFPTLGRNCWEKKKVIHTRHRVN